MGRGWQGTLCLIIISAFAIALLAGCGGSNRKPPKPIPTVGALIINSNPAGASVEIDGLGTGKVTPCEFSLEAGSYELTLRKLGYESWCQEIIVEPGETATIEATLIQESSDPPPAKWTILVYVNGDNNLEDAAIEDINEMEMVGSTDEVNIIVQLDEHKTVGINRYRITRDTKPSTITSVPLATLDELDMGSPYVLKDFVSWGVTTFPAERYMVIIWNHGAGWKVDDGSPLRGVSFDDTSGEYLDMKELQMGLAGILPPGDKYDLIGFDACMMSMVEVAYQVHELARYMVGSEESEPGSGWPYQTWLTAVTNNPEIASSELASRIVVDYMDSYSSSMPLLTQSALDLSRIPSVAAAVESLGTVLENKLPYYGASILQALQDTVSYSYPDFKDIVDFADRVGNYVGDPDLQAVVAQIQSAISTAVIANDYTPDLVGSHGLSVWLPTAGQYVMDLDRYGYDALDFAYDFPGWISFLAAFSTYEPPLSADKVQLSWINPGDSRNDFDLYVFEPGASEWKAAYMSLTTENGCFDRDAGEYGDDSETYAWYSIGKPGQYYFSVGYYQDWNGILSTSPEAQLTITVDGATRVTAIPAGLRPGNFSDNHLVNWPTATTDGLMVFPELPPKEAPLK